MHRLLLFLGLAFALVVGGVAVAETVDGLLGGQSITMLPAESRTGAARVWDDQSTEGMPIVDRTRMPAEPICFAEEILAKFTPGADPAAVAARHGTTIASTIPQLGIYVLAVPPGSQAEKIAVLSSDPEVEYAEPNAVMSIPERPAAGTTPCPDGAPPRE